MDVNESLFLLGFINKDEITIQKIKKAYHQKANFWHPDKNLTLNTIDIMQKINNAYQFLCANWKDINEERMNKKENEIPQKTNEEDDDLSYSIKKKKGKRNKKEREREKDNEKEREKDKEKEKDRKKEGKEEEKEKVVFEEKWKHMIELEKRKAIQSTKLKSMNEINVLITIKKIILYYKNKDIKKYNWLLYLCETNWLKTICKSWYGLIYPNTQNTKYLNQLMDKSYYIYFIQSQNEEIKFNEISAYLLYRKKELVMMKKIDERDKTYCIHEYKMICEFISKEYDER
jgi:hypothetical protein